MKNALLILLIFLGVSAHAQTIMITNATIADVWVKVYYNNPSSFTCPYDYISNTIYVPYGTSPTYTIGTVVWASDIRPLPGGEFIGYEVYDYDPTPNSCCSSCAYPQGQLIWIVGDPTLPCGYTNATSSAATLCTCAPNSSLAAQWNISGTNVTAIIPN